jgi:hypothetical protein
MVCSLLAAKKMGGYTGLIGIGCAFIGGYLILLQPILGIFLVLIAMYIGDVGVKQQEHKNV